MATIETAPPAAGLQPRPPARRALTSRLSGGHVLMIVAGLLAALVNYGVLRSRDEVHTVAVAAADIRPGTRLTAEHVRYVAHHLDVALLTSLVESGELDGEGDYYAANAIAAGDLIRHTDLRASTTPSQLRAISIPVDRAHAVGGQLVTGDRIDVITVVDGDARYIVTDAEVVAVADRADSGLASLDAYSVTIAVDADGALAVALAIGAGSIELVRATGSTPIATD